MVTHVFALDDVTKAFTMLAAGAASAIKILVRCTGPDLSQELPS
jgi:threonine dehydrogenase-like Zn-dependent dehydrogenase